MKKFVQYSPDPSIVHYFSGGFMYNLENEGVGITSMNRLRKFTEILGIIGASKKIIIAILEHSGGEVLGEAINSYGHRSLICFVNTEKFKRTVFWALVSGVIVGHVTQEGIIPEFTQSIKPVIKPEVSGSKYRKQRSNLCEQQSQLEFSE